MKPMCCKAVQHPFPSLGITQYRGVNPPPSLSLNKINTNECTSHEVAFAGAVAGAHCPFPPTPHIHRHARTLEICVRADCSVQ